MSVIETQRLFLRQLTADDAEFILELLNEPAFHQNIGDRGVRTLADAHRYILNGPVASYERFGFGLYLVGLRESGTRVGICGLLKRDFLEEPDIGYAFLQRFWSRGYAFEAASAVMDHARKVLGLRRIVAITTLDNRASIRVLEKLGFRFEQVRRFPDYASDSRFFTSDVE